MAKLIYLILVYLSFLWVSMANLALTDLRCIMGDWIGYIIIITAIIIFVFSIFILKIKRTENNLIMEYISIHKPTIIAGSYVLLFLSVYALDSLLIDGVVIEKKIKVDDSEILIFEKRVGFKVCVYEEDKHQRLTFFRGNQRKEKVIKEIESLKIRHNFE